MSACYCLWYQANLRVACFDSAVHLTGNYVPDQEEDGEDDMEIPPELAALAARMRAGGDLDAME